jgi:L-serine dehydratase
MGGQIRSLLVEFDPKGSLATTHDSQGSDMGLFGGLLGWEATDERLIESPRAIREAGIDVEIRLSEYGAWHPNTYKIRLTGPDRQHEMIALSTGGGMIEIIELDGFQVSLAGDYYETLIYSESGGQEALRYLRETAGADEIILVEREGLRLIEVKGQGFVDEALLAELESRCRVDRVRRLAPVLPVLSRRELRVPFMTCAEMFDYDQGGGLELWELALRYESERGGVPEEEVMLAMEEIVETMQASILTAVEGTEYEDRILGYQSGGFRQRMEAGVLLDGGVLNQIILYTTAMMEAKSAMEVIVAAPTAGACGGLPGACLGAASSMGLGVDEMARAMLAAGLIGVFIAAHATFAAEVGGCQAECGSGSGMAAAALVTLAGGTAKQAVDAASMALQNVLGMICDPVANRVEVPCLGKNVMAASNALACANLALADYDAVIPLDEVIETMDQVGKSIPSELRCTALGGLSITKTSKEIEARLARLRAG